MTPESKTSRKHNMVELKAKVEDLDALRNKLFQRGAAQVGVFRQIDTYYKVPEGRLKLREVEGKTEAELIYYERENIAGPKRSTVYLLTIPKPQILKHILERIMEKRVVVDKKREIYRYEGVQIHLDVVKGLGSFIEFESVTSQEPAQQKEDMLMLERLGEKLGVTFQRLESLSYSDLI